VGHDVTLATILLRIGAHSLTEDIALISFEYFLVPQG